MSTPRRRLVRPSPAMAVSHPDHSLRLQRLRSKLQAERATLARWMGKLRRAFHTVERSQLRIARLERSVARLEG